MNQEFLPEYWDYERKNYVEIGQHPDYPKPIHTCAENPNKNDVKKESKPDKISNRVYKAFINNCISCKYSSFIGTKKSGQISHCHKWRTTVNHLYETCDERTPAEKPKKITPERLQAIVDNIPANTNDLINIVNQNPLNLLHHA